MLHYRFDILLNVYKLDTLSHWERRLASDTTRFGRTLHHTFDSRFYMTSTHLSR